MTKKCKIKCPECNKNGKILRYRPVNAIGTFGKDKFKHCWETCWRCNGKSVLNKHHGRVV